MAPLAEFAVHMHWSPTAKWRWFSETGAFKIVQSRQFRASLPSTHSSHQYHMCRVVSNFCGSNWFSLLHIPEFEHVRSVRRTIFSIRPVNIFQHLSTISQVVCSIPAPNTPNVAPLFTGGAYRGVTVWTVCCHELVGFGFFTRYSPSPWAMMAVATQQTDFRGKLKGSYIKLLITFKN